MSFQRIAAASGLALAAIVISLPAAAKSAAGKGKEEARLRWAHSYPAAVEEAKERGCVVFATFHIDH